jgi:hypothetical protein
MPDTNFIAPPKLKNDQVDFAIDTGGRGLSTRHLCSDQQHRRVVERVP